MVKNLTVISVTPVSSVESGEILYQVAFGKYVKMTEQLAKRIPQQQANGLPKEIGINEIILISKFSSQIPYAVGSKWRFSLNETDGEIKLTQVKS